MYYLKPIEILNKAITFVKYVKQGKVIKKKELMQRMTVKLIHRIFFRSSSFFFLYYLIIATCPLKKGVVNTVIFFFGLRVDGLFLLYNEQ